MGDTHEFDAGTMGCAEGLSQEFKRQINAIPAGDVLIVTARDPIAKDDLPALARLLGHKVRSVEFNQKAEIVVTVERGAKEE
jgi:TusA-related sulfurtransferase